MDAEPSRSATPSSSVSSTDTADTARPPTVEQSDLAQAVPRAGFSRGVVVALAAAALFGASTPLAKVFLGAVDPVLLAGLFYLGSGIGLLLWRGVRFWWRTNGTREASLTRVNLPWLLGAVVTGGVVGPVLLMLGLARTPASSASLLLNLEGVCTALLAWGVFQEYYDRRIVWGMAAITAGGLVLSWGGQPQLGSSWGTVAIMGACLAWGIDNNLTRKIAAVDPLQIAGVKGFTAGVINVMIAFTAGAHVPALPVLSAAMVLGLFGYGASLVLFVLALRHLGTARTGAYFSVAPFFGAALAIAVLGEILTVQLVVAASLMGLGLGLHLTERHIHAHWHEVLEHEHSHMHDEHHPHGDTEEPHSHRHTHSASRHSHAHYPDIHHRHGH